MKDIPPSNKPEKKLVKISRLRRIAIINAAVILLIILSGLYVLFAFLIFFDIFMIERFYLQSAVDTQADDRLSQYKFMALVLVLGLLAIILIILIALLRNALNLE